MQKYGRGNLEVDFGKERLVTHQFEQFSIIHLVLFVEEHDHSRHTNLQVENKGSTVTTTSLSIVRPYNSQALSSSVSNSEVHKQSGFARRNRRLSFPSANIRVTSRYTDS